MDHGCIECGDKPVTYRCIPCHDRDALATAEAANRHWVLAYRRAEEESEGRGKLLGQIAKAIPREYGAGNMAEMVERMAADLAALRQALEPFATAYFTEVYGYGGRSLKATFRPEEVERAKALHYGPSPCAGGGQEDK